MLNVEVTDPLVFNGSTSFELKPELNVRYGRWSFDLSYTNTFQRNQWRGDRLDAALGYQRGNFGARASYQGSNRFRDHALLFALECKF